MYLIMMMFKQLPANVQEVVLIFFWASVLFITLGVAASAGGL